MTHEAHSKDGTARESDLAREESGKSDLVERLNAYANQAEMIHCCSWSELQALMFEAANALATVEAERDEALMIAEGPSTLKELAALAIENNARAFTAEARLAEMVEAVKDADALLTSYGDVDDDHEFKAVHAKVRAALSALADIEGPEVGG